MMTVAPSAIDAITCQTWLPRLRRSFGLTLAAVAAVFASLSHPMLPAVAATSEEATMSYPLVPFSTIVDHWDHHWFLWLPHHPIYEAVEIASREPDHDGRVAVWVWFTERAGAKRQIHYRNDGQLAGFVGGSYRPIDYAISGDVGGPRSLKVRFDDIEDRPVDIEVAFDPTQMLGRQGAGLTDQSGHMSDRAFLIFYRDTNALAQDAHVAIAGQNMTFDRNEAKGGFLSSGRTATASPSASSIMARSRSRSVREDIVACPGPSAMNSRGRGAAAFRCCRIRANGCGNISTAPSAATFFAWSSIRHCRPAAARPNQNPRPSRFRSRPPPIS